MTADKEAIPLRVLKRVLIVEDDEGLRNLILKALRHAGFDTDSVTTGADAIARVQANPDLALLLDQKLPDMTGSDIIKALKAQGFLIPFIVMTGQGDERLAVEMMKLGAADYLVKTLDMVDLLPSLFLRLFRVLDNERQLRATEAKLHESEEKYRILFNNERAAICIFDLETLRFIDMNDAYVKLYGYSREELLGNMNIHNITAEHEDSNRATQEAKANGTIFIPLRWHRKKDGTVFPVEIVGGPYRWQGQRVMFAMAFDISERKQAEADREKLEAQNRHLQKSESLGRMAGSIAHTFNNHLGVVIGNLELALDDPPPAAEFSRRFLTAAMRAANKAAEVSSQMLTYLGQSFDKRELLDLSETCRRCLSILNATLPGKLAIVNDLPSPGPFIMANRNEIMQVLSNLVTNAGEAIGQAGGVVHLVVKSVAAVDISPSHRYPTNWRPQANAYACMEVVDTGSGIASNEIENIFDPFYSSKFTGRGLGLPVVLGILKAHEGAITVESQLGRGSTFRVYLPISG